MIGYKAAASNDVRVIVTLEIPDDALTNMARSTIAVKETAKYRANKAKVLAIEDEKGVPYESATSSHYNMKHIVYKAGETIEEPAYHTNIEVICGEGIHYFLTRRVAELYEISSVQNGQYVSWHDNGQKHQEVTCVDNKWHGPYHAWHVNGRKYVEATYVDGKCHGPYQAWHNNGQKYQEGTYVDGKRHGPYHAWHANGRKCIEATYVDGKLHGTCQAWHDNGQKWEETIYVDGKRHGLCQAWYKNGQKCEEATYVDEKLHGTCKTWYENGEKQSEKTYVNGIRQRMNFTFDRLLSLITCSVW